MSTPSVDDEGDDERRAGPRHCSRAVSGGRAASRVPAALAAGVVEVGVVEPVVERAPHPRPLAVGDREPVGVAVAALVDQRVAEPALPDEAEADRGAARGRVEAVALPLVAPVAEVVEGVAQQQRHRLGGGAAALELAAEQDAADLDRAHRGVDAQVGAEARRAAGLDGHDGERHDAGRRDHVVDDGGELVARARALPDEVGPQRVVGLPAQRGEQVVDVLRPDRLEPDALALEHRVPGRRGGAVPVDGASDALAVRGLALRAREGEVHRHAGNPTRSRSRGRRARPGSPPSRGAPRRTRWTAARARPAGRRGRGSRGSRRAPTAPRPPPSSAGGAA